MAKKPVALRYLGIDIARTIAVGSMVLYHLLFCLHWFGIANIPLENPLFVVWQKGTLALFLLVTGASASIATSTLQKGIKRCVRIGIVALSITLATKLFVPTGPVYFGVLHCIALIQLIFVLPLKQWQWLLIAMAIIAITPFVQSTHLASFYVLPIGITPTLFTSLDYVPLVPWLSVAIIGRIIGNYYKQAQAPITYNERQTIYTILGRYALLVYIVHIPLIVACIKVFYRP